MTFISRVPSGLRSGLERLSPPNGKNRDVSQTPAPLGPMFPVAAINNNAERTLALPFLLRSGATPMLMALGRRSLIRSANRSMTETSMPQISAVRSKLNFCASAKKASNPDE